MSSATQEAFNSSPPTQPTRTDPPDLTGGGQIRQQPQALRAPINPNGLTARLTKIDFPKFDGTLFREWIYRCEQFFSLDGTSPEMKVMLGVDRLDMIKGIPQKLLAFEKFLEENPVWHDKVVLLQITVLTRTDVPEYQKLTSQVHEIAGRINGRFGTLTAVPIHHLGFNLTLTEPVDSPGRRGGDQIKEMDLKLHPELREHLTALCNDPNTTIVVLSGSARSVLDENFGEFNIWLAAEHGMFLRHTGGEWMTTMPEYINTELLDSVRHVFDYFTERTPRSNCEIRTTSLVWNYKYADFEFGRLQARDMLQHLWTGPIANASIDVVQGSRSVEVRAVGVTKGAAMDRIVAEIVRSKPLMSPIDYVLCLGHFLEKDEDVYKFFEPELPLNSGYPRTILTDPAKSQCGDKRGPQKPSGSKAGSKSSQAKGRSNKANGTHQNGALTSKGKTTVQEKSMWSVLDLDKENYFSCAVGRTRTSARYTLGSPDDVVSLLSRLAGECYSE